MNYIKGTPNHCSNDRALDTGGSVTRVVPSPALLREMYQQAKQPQKELADSQWNSFLYILKLLRATDTLSCVHSSPSKNPLCWYH
jgi:hypothetical protein